MSSDRDSGKGDRRNSNSHEPVSPTKKYGESDFRIGGLLGEGAYAKVLLCTRNEDGKQFAVKVVDKGFIKKHRKVEAVMNEREILSKLRHPSIVRLFHAFQNDYSLFFVIELASNGEMFDQIRRVGRYPLDVATHYAAELINCIEYMHSMKVIHRDLKPENILLDDNRHLKVVDFGTAKMMDKKVKAEFDPNEMTVSEIKLWLDKHDQQYEANQDKAYYVQMVQNAVDEKERSPSFVGTAEYVSPEVLDPDQFGEVSYEADIWAYGCILYQMIVGKPPFRGKSEHFTFNAILNDPVTFSEELEVDSHAQTLIVAILKRPPSERLTIEQIKKSEIFKDTNFEGLTEREPPFLQDTQEDEDNEESTDEWADDPDNSEFRPVDDAADKGSTELVEVHKSNWDQFLDTDESIVFTGLVAKRRQPFTKKRQLILTTTPRLLYVDPVNLQVKGTVPWGPTLWAELKDQRTFFVHTEKRKYYMQGLSSGAKCWVDAINNAVKEQLGGAPNEP